VIDRALLVPSPHARDGRVGHLYVDADPLTIAAGFVARRGGNPPRPQQPRGR
jgi:hypothetical protein